MRKNLDNLTISDINEELRIIGIEQELIRVKK
jgi:hypothetical protein